VTIDGKTECTIHPQYYHTKKIYELSQDLFTLRKTIEELKLSLSFPAKVDYRWCTLYIQVNNTGNTTISDYKLYLDFVGDSLDKTSAMLPYVDFRLTDAQEAAMYDKIEKTQEVYIYSDCEDLFIEPKERILVQTDSRSFKIGIKPKDGASKIIMHWDFKSKDYNKQGTIVINVEPLIEEREQIIQVNTIKELKDEEFVLEPKIIIH
jgi:hypothetical protein